jgi:hypothetical protein
MAPPAPLPPLTFVFVVGDGFEVDAALLLKLLTKSRATLAALRASLMSASRTSPDAFDFGCGGGGAAETVVSA